MSLMKFDYDFEIIDAHIHPFIHIFIYIISGGDINIFTDDT